MLPFPAFSKMQEKEVCKAWTWKRLVLLCKNVYELMKTLLRGARWWYTKKSRNIMTSSFVCTSFWIFIETTYCVLLVCSWRWSNLSILVQFGISFKKQASAMRKMTVFWRKQILWSFAGAAGHPPSYFRVIWYIHLFFSCRSGSVSSMLYCSSCVFFWFMVSTALHWSASFGHNFIFSAQTTKMLNGSMHECI